MSILSDRDIFEAIDKKIISIEPLIADHVQPGSVDLTLHGKIEIMTGGGAINCDLGKEELERRVQKIDIESGYDLAPGAFVTAYSQEKIKIGSFVSGEIFNRNSLARWGLDAAISAFVNPGFHGRKVIVLHNFGPAPIRIRAGMRVCQLRLMWLASEAARDYDRRHDTAALADIADIIRRNRLAMRKDDIDTSLSDFLNEQIQLAASR